MQSQETTLAILPARPRGPYANKFAKVDIVSNHFEATLKGIERVIVYSVKIQPRIESKDKDGLKRIQDQIRAEVATKIGKPVFRGFNIFSSRECKQILNYTVGPYNVQIAQKSVYEVAAKPDVFKLFLNVSLRGIMSRLGYVQIGRSGKYFNTSSKSTIDNLNMFKGFMSSFSQCDKGVFLRVDTARKIVRKDTVMDVIDAIYKNPKITDKEEKRNEVKKALCNSIIMTNYGKLTFYRVVDVEFKSMLDVPISDDIPNMKAYYKAKYNIDIKNQKQPLLLAENKMKRRQTVGSDDRPTYLVPELCLMTGIPDNFDEQRRKSVSQNTILNPSDKAKEIKSFMDQLVKKGEIQDLADMGINLNKDLNRFQAKQIENPTLELGNKQVVQKGKEAFFNLFDKPIFQAKHNISVVILHTKYADVGGLVDTLTKTARNLKVELSVQKLQGPMFKDTDAVKLMDRALEQFDKCNLLMVCIPQNLKTSYPKLKQATLAVLQKREILTQFVVENTLKKKGAQSIHTKLLLQMIAKRGNIIWIPSYQEEMTKVMDKTMLIGMDTGSKGSCNLMAACGTTNSTFSLYSSATTKNGEGDRKFNAMLEVTLKCVEGYVARNKSPPKELIIFFNASPGDQINLYQENYSKKLQENFQKTYSIEVRLTVIMVNLRNSERFFTTDHSNNVKPGTLVSSGIVSKNYDFFIISQQSRGGCSIPNHYKVITAESKLEEGHLQELIFSQCFNYVNWTGSIKIPAILQYAKKCARFNAEVMNGMDVSHGLQSRPYFV